MRDLVARAFLALRWRRRKRIDHDVSEAGAEGCCSRHVGERASYKLIANKRSCTTGTTKAIVLNKDRGLRKSRAVFPATPCYHIGGGLNKAAQNWGKNGTGNTKLHFL